MKRAVSLFICIVCFVVSKGQNYYFPPNTGDQWDMVTPSSLGWCDDKLDTVYKFLEAKDSRGFIILQDGKIAVEKYFNGFSKDSVWYWASVGKSLTAALVGIAQQENDIDINKKASTYLGNGWTECTQQQEDAITVKNLLSMTSGLNDLLLPNPDCTDPKCFKYKADAGTRWAYHSGAYYMLHQIIDSATDLNMNQYTSQKLRNTIGMQGLWAGTLFISRTRDMARFGSLALNRGIWNGTPIISDTAYFNAMVNSSQTKNPSYGYLWWLNGKGRYKAPASQITFFKDLVPNAPEDMYAGMGKNEQRMYVVPSKNMVVVRVGDPTGQPALAVSTFDNELWGLLNDVFCKKTSISQIESQEEVKIFPNPAKGSLTIETNLPTTIEIYTIDGKLVFQKSIHHTAQLDISSLAQGIYTLKSTNKRSVLQQKLVKQ